MHARFSMNIQNRVIVWSSGKGFACRSEASQEACMNKPIVPYNVGYGTRYIVFEHIQEKKKQTLSIPNPRQSLQLAYTRHLESGAGSNGAPDLTVASDERCCLPKLSRRRRYADATVKLRPVSSYGVTSSGEGQHFIHNTTARSIRLQVHHALVF